jgi:hypothetical protein
MVEEPSLLETKFVAEPQSPSGFLRRTRFGTGRRLGANMARSMVVLAQVLEIGEWLWWWR